MDREVISIIVPVYNIAPQLPRCLDSILAQNYKELEVITVDDGSTDGSGAILEQYARRDPRIRVIHQKNGGVTRARFAGIRAAAGEWIGFVDGDDYIEPDMYERLLGNALKFGAQISHCGYRMVFAGGKVSWFYNTGRLAQQDKPTGVKDLLAGSMIEPGLCNKLFHKTLLHSLFHSGVENMDIKINEDLLMNYYLFAASEKSVFEDFCPYHYMIRSNSASRSPLNIQRIWDPIRVKQIILEQNMEGLEKDATRAWLSTCISVYNGLMLEPGKDFRPEEPKIRQLLKSGKESACLLSKKQQLLYGMIVHIPWAYRYIYRIYAKYFLKNKYDLK